jgi:hypothetical protein
MEGVRVDEPKHFFPNPPNHQHVTVTVPRFRIKAARKSGSRQPLFSPLAWADGRGAVPLEGGKEA